MSPLIPYMNPFAISLTLLGAWVALAVVAWTVGRVHRAVVVGRLTSEPARVLGHRGAPPSAGRSHAA